MKRKFISRRGFISTSMCLVIMSILPKPLIASEKVKKRTVTRSNKILYNTIRFNGVANDTKIHVQHLGRGYRIYNQFLMRFHIQDSLSPFSEGGVNTYGYVSGDPLNYVDPSGHMRKSTTGIVKPQLSKTEPKISRHAIIPGMTKLATTVSKWKVYYGKEGKIEISAIGRISSIDVRMVSDALGRKPSIRKRGINIFTGMHGSPSGKNWNSEGDSKYRDVNYILSDISDLYLENDSRNDVVALPAPWTGRDGYIEKTADPHTHGIHAYCYSDRDESFQRAMSSTGMTSIGFL
ncbi:RHS repeat-associated core domain-containing protein [Aeromonas jandaei]|uniref:RHS repeat-associated core domain-containing protein n=1 Tax=Aeromonas jandaei TaxID=650 RepID=UPI003BA02725